MLSRFTSPPLAFSALCAILIGASAAVSPWLGGPTDLYDYWLPWAKATGGSHPWLAYQVAGANYPPLWLYWLTFVEALGPDDRSPWRTLLVKLPAILSHAIGVLIAAGVAAKIFGERASLPAAVGWAACLPLFVNGALWGQTDAVLALLLLLVVRAALEGHLCLLGFTVGVAVAFKAQAVAAAPAIAIYVVARHGWRGVWSGAWPAMLCWGLLVLPMVLAGSGEHVLRAYTGAVDYLPLRQISANNIWWLMDAFDVAVRGIPASIARDDRRLVFPNVVPGLRYTHIGLSLFAAATAWILVGLVRRPSASRLVLCVAVGGFAFFMLLTQMHSRYAVPTLACLALLVGVDRRARWLFIGLCVTATINQGVYLFRENHVHELRVPGRWTSAVDAGSRAVSLTMSLANVGLLVAGLWLVGRPDLNDRSLPSPPPNGGDGSGA